MDQVGICVACDHQPGFTFLLGFPLGPILVFVGPPGLENSVFADRAQHLLALLDSQRLQGVEVQLLFPLRGFRCLEFFLLSLLNSPLSEHFSRDVGLVDVVVGDNVLRSGLSLEPLGRLTLERW